GVAAATSGAKPVAVILVAQVANGLLLPVIAVFLLIAANDRRRLGAAANGLAANFAGGAIALLAAGLGLRGLGRAFGLF
ncbi:MAG: divalent metal cation transporter, partial [Pseudomonadota bacterium]